jgi:hypothetical protein
VRFGTSREATVAGKTIEQELLALESECWQAITDRNPEPVMRLTKSFAPT